MLQGRCPGITPGTDPAETFRAASILLRGCPSLAIWLAGWASTEFPLHVLAGHALTAVNVPPVNRFTCGLAAQRADRVLREALVESHGEDYTEHVRHPVPDAATRRASVAGFWHATQHSRRYAATTTNISYGPGGRDHLLDIWRLPEVMPGHRAPVLLQVPGGGWAISEKRGQAVPLMSRMAQLGWVCVRINYSRIPAAPGRPTSSTSSGPSPGSGRTSPTTGATRISSPSRAARPAPMSVRWPP